MKAGKPAEVSMADDSLTPDSNLKDRRFFIPGDVFTLLCVDTYRVNDALMRASEAMALAQLNDQAYTQPLLHAVKRLGDMIERLNIIVEETPEGAQWERKN